MTAEAKGPVDLAVEEQPDGSVVVALPEDELELSSAESEQESANEGGVGSADERLTGHTDDEDDAQAATKELQGARTEAEREAIRERRRHERAEKKDNARRREAEKDRLLTELQQTVRQQAEQIGLIQRQNQGTELAQLDAQIKRTADAQAHYRGIIADGVTQQNGAVVADATARMQAAGREHENLVNIRRSYTQQQTQQPATTQSTVTEAAPTADPRVLSHAVAWMNANSWYNPRDNTPEAQLVRALDAAVHSEGFKPDTKEYWDELSKRVTTNLPHRTGKSNIGASTSRRSVPGSVVTGTGRSSSTARSGTPGNFVLSAERTKALKDAGMWDDPKARSDAIRRFREYDRTHAADSRS
jgi:hypothetical protein